MSMNEAKYIKDKALQLGAKPADWRKWKFRGRIPTQWRERLFRESYGTISFQDMDRVFFDREDMGGWIRHDGKGIPTDPGKRVIVRFRDGQEETEKDACFAEVWGISGPRSNWNHADQSPDDIVAYKILD